MLESSQSQREFTTTSKIVANLRLEVQRAKISYDIRLDRYERSQTYSLRELSRLDADMKEKDDKVSELKEDFKKLEIKNDEKGVKAKIEKLEIKNEEISADIRRLDATVKRILDAIGVVPSHDC